MSDKPRLTVVIINDFANINGGAAKVAVDTAVGLSNHDVDVYFFCASGLADESFKWVPLKGIIHLEQQEILYDSNKFKALLRGIWNFKAYKKLNELLKNLNRENTIIHIHGWTKGLSVSPIAAALKQRFLTVITLHDFFIYCPNGGFYNYPKNAICHKVPLSLGCILSDCDSRSYVFKIYRVLRSSVQRAIFHPYKKRVSLIALSKLSSTVLSPYVGTFKHSYFVENPVGTFKRLPVDVTQNKNCVFIGRLSSEKGAIYFVKQLVS